MDLGLDRIPGHLQGLDHPNSAAPNGPTRNASWKYELENHPGSLRPKQQLRDMAYVGSQIGGSAAGLAA